jgi:hypothetical protein
MAWMLEGWEAWKPLELPLRLQASRLFSLPAILLKPET